MGNMKKALIILTVMALASAVSAATNYITNGSFEQTFSTYTGAEGSAAYGRADQGGPASGWSPDVNWGYVMNPPASGIDRFGNNIGLTGVTDGVAAYGAWGAAGHYYEIFQNTGAQAAEGDTVRLTFDSNALSADYGANAWLNAKIQFIGGGDILHTYVNTP